jgi:hypothetical protein
MFAPKSELGYAVSLNQQRSNTPGTWPDTGNGESAMEYTKDDRTYQLAGNLTPFQLGLYMHLADWKRQHITQEPGLYPYRGRLVPYDVMFPDHLHKELHPIYRPILDRVKAHQQRFPFKLHKFVGHMASSQVACLNLFLPLLQHPGAAAQVLRLVKPDLVSIATDHLDNGFQIEYWPGKGDEPGLLKDHTPAAGTDSDIAIAYRDTENRLNLWLIEHKLTEKDFTPCGGAKSKSRGQQHRCEPAADVVRDHSICYYHDRCRYAYWDITDRHPEVFPPDNLTASPACPFKDGMNQLWRNMVQALAVEDAGLYHRVTFSVVHHPDNPHLIDSMKSFKGLLGQPDRFSWFTADRLINAAAAVPEYREWAAWYKGLYRIRHVQA